MSEIIKNSENKIIFSKTISLEDNTLQEIKENLSAIYEIEQYNSKNITDIFFGILLEVANDGFGINMSLEDIKNHIYKSDKVYLLKINGDIVGFSSIAYLNGFVYRFGTVIKREYQNHGLYTILNQVIFDENKKYFVRTQNKNVIKALNKSFKNVLYGDEALDFLQNEGLTKEKISKFMLEKGDKIETLCEKGIFKGVYGGKMGDKTRVDYIDDSFYSGFNPDRGDSLLVVYFDKK